MAISKRYKRLFKSHYEPVYKERVGEITDQIRGFLDGVLAKHFEFSEHTFMLCVDGTRLNHAVKSYFYDIIRFKEFHFSAVGDDEEAIHQGMVAGGKHLNDPKQAAFMAKWLVRTKPLMIDNVGDVDLTDAQQNVMLTINELFSVMYANSVLGLSFDYDRADDIIYQLHYRNTDEAMLEKLFLTWIEE